MSTSAIYWREIPQRYRYEAGKCTKCGKIFFPPRLICNECKSREFENVTLNTEGEVVTYTVIHVAPTGFEDQTPYAVGLVKLKDGVTITTQIADCPEEDLKIGMPVKLEFRRISEDCEAAIIKYGYKCVPI